MANDDKLSDRQRVKLGAWFGYVTKRGGETGQFIAGARDIRPSQDRLLAPPMQRAICYADDRCPHVIVLASFGFPSDLSISAISPSFDAIS